MMRTENDTIRGIFISMIIHQKHLFAKSYMLKSMKAEMERHGEESPESADSRQLALILDSDVLGL